MPEIAGAAEMIAGFLHILGAIRTSALIIRAFSRLGLRRLAKTQANGNRNAEYDLAIHPSLLL